MEYQAHGKSVAIKLMLGRSAIMGRKIAVLDPEGEYIKLIEKLGGRYIKVKQGHSSGINIFDIEPYHDGKKEYNHIDYVFEMKRKWGAVQLELRPKYVDWELIYGFYDIYDVLFGKTTMTHDF